MTADKRTVTTDALETLGKIISPNEKRDAIHLAVEPVVAGEELYPGDHIYLATDGRAFLPVEGGSRTLGIVDPFLLDPVKAGERFWLVVYPRQITSLRHVWTHPAFPQVPELAHVPNAPPVFIGSNPATGRGMGLGDVLRQMSTRESVTGVGAGAMPVMPALIPVPRGERIQEDPESLDADEINESRDWIADYASDFSLTYDELISAARDYLRSGNYYTGGAEMEGERVTDEFWDHYETVTGTEVSLDNRGSFFSCSC